MQWNDSYTSSRTIEDERKDYANLRKMMSEYDEQINSINAKIARLKQNYTTGTAKRIETLEGMLSNLLFAYKGLCSNERAIRERIEKMGSETR